MVAVHIVDIVVRIQRNTDENARIIKFCFSDREVFDAIFSDEFLLHEGKLTGENVLERILHLNIDLNFWIHQGKLGWRHPKSTHEHNLEQHVVKLICACCLYVVSTVQIEMQDDFTGVTRLVLKPLETLVE